jgi:uncharacterized membrane protein YfcA
VHLHAGTVNLRLVRWLALGSVPAAFLGAFLLRELGQSSSAEKHVQQALGAALLVGAVAMGLRFLLDRRRGRRRIAQIGEVAPRPLPTVALGVLGGLIVGMTSVGSGSLMVVVLLFVYPTLGAGQLVGTDLTQAVPLTLAAAAGALVFGRVEFGVTTSLIIGSVPAVLVGSLLSANVPERFLRPVIAFAILASGLKYAGLPTLALGWTLCGVLFAGGALWLELCRRERSGARRGGEGGELAVTPQTSNGGAPLTAAGRDRPPSAPL